MLKLDHLAVLGETLEEAAVHVEGALGVPTLPGGKHARFGTHNRLLGLEDGVYLEAIAKDPGAPPPDRPRWFGLDRFRGPARLARWICRVPDIDAALETLPMAGPAVQIDRGGLRWKMGVPEDGDLPFDGVFPALIEWQVPVPPGNSLSASGWRLETLTLTHPEAGELRDVLAPHLCDDRVVFSEDPVPALRASFVGPRGMRVLQ